MNKGFSNMDYYNYGATANQFPQFQMPQQQQVGQYQGNMLIYSQGKEAAKAYPLAPERTCFFLDDQEPYLYRKTTDKFGKTIEFKSFKLEEEPDDEVYGPEANFVTKDDFNNFTNSINNTLNELKSMMTNNNKQNKHYNQNREKVNNNG